MQKKVRLLLLCLFLSSTIQAQYHHIQYDSIYSVHLQELRQIKISVPKQYDASTHKKLDVLYVLDGEWATSLSETVYEFLEYAAFIPTQMIIVSIPNYYDDGANMRRRDFTPTQVNNRPLSGGADSFLSFLKEELIPHIDKKYTTETENNILYGSSLGGLFTVYTYLQEPALFKSYIAIEPVLRWDEHYMSRTALKTLETRKDIHNTLWISSRDGKAFEDMGISTFESLLKEKAPQGLSWKIGTYSNETHFSVIWKGLYDGMKFTYTKSKANKIINRADATNN